MISGDLGQSASRNMTETAVFFSHLFKGAIRTTKSQVQLFSSYGTGIVVRDTGKHRPNMGHSLRSIH
jgi:hypothetical protein